MNTDLVLVSTETKQIPPELVTKFSKSGHYSLLKVSRGAERTKFGRDASHTSVEKGENG